MTKKTDHEANGSPDVKARKPKKKRTGRPNGKTGLWIESFLSRLRESPNVTAACKAAGIDPATAYGRRRRDSEFARLWQEALDEATDDLVDNAWKRAKSKSDLLTIFLLKKHRPEVYEDIHRHQVEGVPGGEPIRVTREQILDDEDYLEYRRQLAIEQDRMTVDEPKENGEGSAGGNP